MFGFIRFRKNQLTSDEVFEFKTHYCGLCHTLRLEYGLPAALLTGWDACVLAITVNAQIQETTQIDLTRCPITGGLGYKSITQHGVATSYAAAITVLLLNEKLNDNIADNNSVLAKMASKVSTKHINHALKSLTNLNFPLKNAGNLRKQQTIIESKKALYSFDEVTGPSAKIVSLIFAHTAQLTGNKTNLKPIMKIGESLGRLVTLLDACHDYQSDLAHCQFNSIARSFPSGNAGQRFIDLNDFRQLEAFLFYQLQIIRENLTQLHLYQYRTLLENIFILGLYDSVKEALEKLSKYVLNFHECNTSMFVYCPYCGNRLIDYSHICTLCDENVTKGAIEHERTMPSLS